MSEIVRLKTQTQIDNEAAVWTWRLDSGELTAAERDRARGVAARGRPPPPHLRGAGPHLERPRPPRRAARETRKSPLFARPERRRRFRAQPVLASGRGRGARGRSRGGALDDAAARHAGHVDRCRSAAARDAWRTARSSHSIPTRCSRCGSPRSAGTSICAGARRILRSYTTLARPFFVHAGDAVIRDVGTQFEVRLHTDRDIDVLVNEGQVEVRGRRSGGVRNGRQRHSQCKTRAGCAR